MNPIESEGHRLKTHELRGQMFEDALDLAYAVIDGVDARADAAGYQAQRFRFPFVLLRTLISLMGRGVIQIAVSPTHRHYTILILQWSLDKLMKSKTNNELTDQDLETIQGGTLPIKPRLTTAMNGERFMGERLMGGRVLDHIYPNLCPSIRAGGRVIYRNKLG